MQTPMRTPTPTLPLAPSRLRDRAALMEAEYLAANGLGGYAMGTVAGPRTRSYHGLLIAALRPPTGRTLLVAAVDATVELAGETVQLATHRFLDGTIAPGGDRRLSEFRLADGLPHWTYDLGAGRLLTCRLALPHGENTAILMYSYDAPEDAPPLTLHLAPLVTHRDHHGRTHAGDGHWNWRAEPDGNDTVRVTAFDGATPFHLAAWGMSGESASWTPSGVWYYNFSLPAEVARGFDDGEDLWQPGTFTVTLTPGSPVFFAAAVEPAHATWGHISLAVADTRERRHGIALDARTPATEAEGNATALAHLRLAADSFLVRREGGDAAGSTVVAGYPWFTDWGRDTMIALPGLLLATGRHAEAADTLRTFARYAQDGLIPNTFPEGDAPAQYNTADATLWFFRALERYLTTTGDRALLRDLWPTLAEIVAAHERGTLFGIGVDPADGLLRAGEPGVQLTWMDAKVDDWVVTPRTGKPVEVNGLWLHALHLMAAWSPLCDTNPTPYLRAATKVGTSFTRRFWNAERGYLYDVLDTPDGTDDATLRPNQCVALALSSCPVPEPCARRALAAVTTHLLTPYGLRTLAPDDPRYIGRYGGDRYARDGAYHQGTVWPWLLGPYADALLRLGGTRADVRTRVRPLLDHLRVAGLGSISEVFDGDPPHTPGGCPFQAWSVAELLRLLTDAEGN